MEKRGILFKKGRGAIGTLLSAATQWKPRYVVLSPQEGTMRYYSDNTQSKLLGAVDLTQAYVTVQEVRVRKSALQITTSVRSWWFAASSDAERDDWIKALKHVLEEKKLLQSSAQNITKLLGFGSNNLGQLGHLRSSAEKFAAIPAESITSIATGDSFCLATTPAGTMFAWGWAASGRLCMKADEDDSATGAASARKTLVKPPPVQWQPRPVLPALFGNPTIKITQVACGAHNGYALSDAGAVYSWGRAGSSLGLGPDQNIQDKHNPQAIGSFLNLRVLRISAAGSCAAAILDGGRLFMWGQSEFMESTTFNSWEAHLPELIDSFGGIGVHTIAIGEKHFIALLDNKNVYSWGSSEFGQLGHGNLERHVKPKRIEALAEIPVERVFAAADYSYCISNTGKAYSWGNSANGCLGLKLETLVPGEQFIPERSAVIVPVPVESIRAGFRCKSVATGKKSCLLLCEGLIYACGENVFSQWASMAGLGDKLYLPTALPIDFVCDEVAAGDDFVLVAQSDKPLDKRASVMLPAAAAMLQKAESRVQGLNSTPQAGSESTTSLAAPTATNSGLVDSYTPPHEAPPTPPVSGIFTPQTGSGSSDVSPPLSTSPTPTSSAGTTPTNSVLIGASPVASRPTSTATVARADSGRRIATMRPRVGAMDSQNLGGVSTLLDRISSLESENERLKRELDEAVTQLRSTKSENEMIYTELNALRLQLPYVPEASQYQAGYQQPAAPQQTVQQPVMQFVPMQQQQQPPQQQQQQQQQQLAATQQAEFFTFDN